MTQGVFIPLGADTPEQLIERLEEVSGRSGDLLPESAGGQTMHQITKASSKAKH
jgi:hypothetical protein